MDAPPVLVPELRTADNPHLAVAGRHAMALALLLAEQLVERRGYRALMICDRAPAASLTHPLLELADCLIDIGTAEPEDGLAFVWELLRGLRESEVSSNTALRATLDEIGERLRSQPACTGRHLQACFRPPPSLERWEYVLAQLCEHARQEHYPLPQVLVESDGGLESWSVPQAVGAVSRGRDHRSCCRVRLFVPEPVPSSWYATLDLEPEVEELMLRTLANKIASDLMDSEEFAGSRLEDILDYATELARQRPWEAAWLHATAAAASAEPVGSVAAATIVSALESAGFADESALLQRLTAGRQPWPVWERQPGLMLVARAAAGGQEIGWKIALGLLASREQAQGQTAQALPKVLIVEAALGRWPMVEEQIHQLLRIGRKHGLSVIMVGPDRSGLASVEPLLDLVFTTGEAITQYDPTIAAGGPQACHLHRMLSDETDEITALLDHGHYQRCLQMIA